MFVHYPLTGADHPSAASTLRPALASSLRVWILVSSR